MSGLPVTTLRRAITCFVCFGQYTKPKKLDCQHTFCEVCLLGLVHTRNSFECPVCRTMYSMSPDDIRELKTNHTMVALIEAIGTGAGELPGTHRQVNESSSGVVELSAECQVCMSLEAELSRCVHCARAVCNQCMARHTSYMHKDLQQLVETIETNASASLRCSQKAYDSISTTKDIHTSCDEARGKVRTSVDEAVAALSKRKHKLFEEIDAHFDVHSRTEHSRRQDELQSIAAFAESVTQPKNSVKKTQRELEDIRKKLVGDLNRVHTEDASPLSLDINVVMDKTDIEKAINTIASVKILNISPVDEHTLPINKTRTRSRSRKRKKVHTSGPPSQITTGKQEKAQFIPHTPVTKNNAHANDTPVTNTTTQLTSGRQATTQLTTDEKQRTSITTGSKPKKQPTCTTVTNTTQLTTDEKQRTSTTTGSKPKKQPTCTTVTNTTTQLTTDEKQRTSTTTGSKPKKQPTCTTVTNTTTQLTTDEKQRTSITTGSKPKKQPTTQLTTDEKQRTSITTGSKPKKQPTCTTVTNTATQLTTFTKPTAEPTTDSKQTTKLTTASKPIITTATKITTQVITGLKHTTHISNGTDTTAQLTNDLTPTTGITTDSKPATQLATDSKQTTPTATGFKPTRKFTTDSKPATQIATSTNPTTKLTTVTTPTTNIITGQKTTTQNVKTIVENTIVKQSKSQYVPDAKSVMLLAADIKHQDALKTKYIAQSTTETMKTQHAISTTLPANNTKLQSARDKTKGTYLFRDNQSSTTVQLSQTAHQTKQEQPDLLANNRTKPETNACTSRSYEPARHAEQVISSRTAETVGNLLRPIVTATKTKSLNTTEMAQQTGQIKTQRQLQENSQLHNESQKAAAFEYDEARCIDIDLTGRLTKWTIFTYTLLYTLICYHNMYYV